MQGSFSSDAATALAAVRSGSSTITALLDAVVLDPSVDWIAAKRAAAADKRLDSAMALNLWLAHMQELLPVRLQRISEVWHAHGGSALTALQSVCEATDLELDARTKLDAVKSYEPPCQMSDAVPVTDVEHNSATEIVCWKGYCRLFDDWAAGGIHQLGLHHQPCTKCSLSKSSLSLNFLLV